MMNRERREVNWGKDKSLRHVKIFAFLFDMLNALREGRRCASDSCMYISADSFCFSNDTLISQPTDYLSLVVL